MGGRRKGAGGRAQGGQRWAQGGGGRQGGSQEPWRGAAQLRWCGRERPGSARSQQRAQQAEHGAAVALRRAELPAGSAVAAQDLPFLVPLSFDCVTTSALQGHVQGTVYSEQALCEKNAESGMNWTGACQSPLDCQSITCPTISLPWRVTSLHRKSAVGRAEAAGEGGCSRHQQNKEHYIMPTTRTPGGSQPARATHASQPNVLPNRRSPAAACRHPRPQGQ